MIQLYKTETGKSGLWNGDEGRNVRGLFRACNGQESAPLHAFWHRLQGKWRNEELCCGKQKLSLNWVIESDGGSWRSSGREERGVGILTLVEARGKCPDVLLCYSLAYVFETEYLTKSGARVGVRKPQWSSCLWPQSTGVIGAHSHAFHRSGRDLNSGSRAYTAGVPLPWAVSLSPYIVFLFCEYELPFLSSVWDFPGMVINSCWNFSVLCYALGLWILFKL